MAKLVVIIIIFVIIIIIITLQFSFHSVAVILIVAQRKQIGIYKKQHKRQYKQHKTHSIPVHILTKHQHKPENAKFPNI